MAGLKGPPRFHNPSGSATGQSIGFPSNPETTVMDQRIRKKENKPVAVDPAETLGNQSNPSDNKGFNFLRPAEPGFGPQAIRAISTVSSSWGKERRSALFLARSFSGFVSAVFLRLWTVAFGIGLQVWPQKSPALGRAKLFAGAEGAQKPIT